jgi:hypothetical protein
LRRWLLNKPIDWDEYNEPPFLPQWLSEGETLELARYDDGLRMEIEKQIRAMVEQYDIDKVKGVLLDRIGKILAEVRNGNDDALYRIMLKLRKLLNTADGTVNDVIKVIKFFYTSEIVNISPNYPAGISIFHDGEGPNVDFNKIMAAVVPSGVAYDTKELFYFVENILMAIKEPITVRRNTQDLFPSGLRYNGRFLCDQGEMVVCDGTWVSDGSMKCKGFISVIGTIFDYYLQELFCDGNWICNGDKVCSGFDEMYEDEFIQLPILPREYTRDELHISMRINAQHDITIFHDNQMPIRITNPLICDGSKMPTCSKCDGSIICDGSYTGYDGRYYRHEIMEEVMQ